MFAMSSLGTGIFSRIKGAVDDSVAAIMLELIQGEGGVNPVTDEFAQAIQALCDEYGILLIVDEVQTGIGRTGTKFAFEQTVLKPHIASMALKSGLNHSCVLLYVLKSFV